MSEVVDPNHGEPVNGESAKVPEAQPRMAVNDLRELTTEGGRQQRHQAIAEELNDLQMIQIQHVFDRIAQLQADRDAIENPTERIAKRAEVEEKVDGLRDQLDNKFGTEKVDRVRQLQANLYELEQGYPITLSGVDGQAALHALLGEATNSDVSDRAHVFVDPKYLGKFAAQSSEAGKMIFVQNNSSENPTANIPLGMFASADAFESWYGRPEGWKKDDRPSSEVIEDYASRTSEPPPVNRLTGFVLPDGRVYFLSHDAHRVGAAIRRGDTHIAFHGTLQLHFLDQAPDRL